MDVVTQGEGLAVSQEARDAAAGYEDEYGACSAEYIAAIYDGSADKSMLVQAFQRAIDAAEARQREADAKVAEAQAEVFAGDGYAVGQPMASFAERFACNLIAAAIREGTKS